MTVLSLRTSSTMTRLFQVRRKQWPEMSSPDQWCPDLKHCCLDKILLTQHTPVRSCNNGNKKTAKKYQTRVANNKRHQVEEFSFDRTFPWNTNFKINPRQNRIKFCDYVFIFKNITLEYLIWNLNIWNIIIIISKIFENCLLSNTYFISPERPGRLLLWGCRVDRMSSPSCTWPCTGWQGSWCWRRMIHLTHEEHGGSCWQTRQWQGRRETCAEVWESRGTCLSTTTPSVLWVLWWHSWKVKDLEELAIVDKRNTEV